MRKSPQAYYSHMRWNEIRGKGKKNSYDSVEARLIASTDTVLDTYNEEEADLDELHMNPFYDFDKVGFEKDSAINTKIAIRHGPNEKQISAHQKSCELLKSLIEDEDLEASVKWNGNNSFCIVSFTLNLSKEGFEKYCEAKRQKEEKKKSES